jgi:hypothetical protein
MLTGRLRSAKRMLANNLARVETRLRRPSFLTTAGS